MTVNSDTYEGCAWEGDDTPGAFLLGRSLTASGFQTGENHVRVEPGDHIDEERAKREADVNLPGEAAHS